ncbi:hypothetical protein PAL_GLEAN10013559 [Pteropus alecto]|uniref:Uncharacterized protein n=1 Tax=Pteropus alecto TaxID=9402 RepID=L5JYD2_PTEAL|nr:hypothetical protein PAL_GLEAN10013559 [Pteropus alecto]
MGLRTVTGENGFLRSKSFKTKEIISEEHTSNPCLGCVQCSVKTRDLGFEFRLFREDGEVVGNHGDGVSDLDEKILIVEGICYGSAAELIFHSKCQLLRKPYRLAPQCSALIPKTCALLSWWLRPERSE